MSWLNSSLSCLPRLGQLCTLVGLSTEDLSHPLVTSILKSHQPSALPQPGAHGVPPPSQPNGLPPSHQARPPPSHGLPGGSAIASGQAGFNMQQTSHSQYGQPSYPSYVPLGFEGLQSGQVVGSMPLGYPPMQGAYTQPVQNTNITHIPSGVPVLGGQSGGNLAPPMPMAYYTTQQPAQITNQPLVRQPQIAERLPSTQQTSTPQIFVSTAQTQESVRTSDVLTHVAGSSHVTAPVAKEQPVDTVSSTEGFFAPSAVQITSEPSLLSKDRQTSSETSATTVRPHHRAQELQAVQQVDSETAQVQPSPDPGVDSSHDLGQEPELTKASDSMDFDLGNYRAIQELHFEDTAESPEKPSLEFGRDDTSRESPSPTKGIGSPTESDHSARDHRGSPRGASPIEDFSEDFEDGNGPRGASPNQDYSEDFEVGNDGESENDEDLFRDSDGSVPGLSSDESF